jgi:IclR family KDG regulon transcriptional repressor
MIKKNIRTIQSLDRAISILRLLADHTDGVCLSDIASTLHLNPQTAQSLLRTLQYHRLIEQEFRGGPYKIAIDTLFLAKPFLARSGGYQAVNTFVKTLAEQCGEYVVLNTLRQDQLLLISEAWGNNPLMVSPTFGIQRERLHTMSTGKLLLTFSPQREELLKQIDFSKTSRETTAKTTKELSKQLDVLREKKFVLIRRERSPEISSAAVAVENTAGIVVAALGIAFPDAKYSTDYVNGLFSQLRDTAGKLSAIPVLQTMTL